MYRLVLIITIFFYQFSFGQKRATTDSSTVHVRNFSATDINQYKADALFQYEMIVEPPRSLWDRFWEQFWGKINRLLETETGQNTFTALLVILAISILVFFVLKITGMSGVGLFGMKNKEDTLDYSVMEDDIHGINFDAAIEQAVNDRNFRFAVRLLYLQTLKNLADGGLINWQINKTNVAYVEELNGNAYQQNFRNLTKQFENNWYGYLPIDENEFTDVRNHFNQFNRKRLERI